MCLHTREKILCSSRPDHDVGKLVSRPCSSRSSVAILRMTRTKMLIQAVSSVSNTMWIRLRAGHCAAERARRATAVVEMAIADSSCAGMCVNMPVTVAG